MRFGCSALAFVCLSLAGCRERGFNQESQVQHALGQPAITRVKGLWASLNAEKALSFFRASEEANLVSGGGPVQERLRSWLLAMHGAMKKAYPEAMAPISEPIVLLSAKPEPNAATKGVPVCFDLPGVAGAGAVREVEVLSFRPRANELGVVSAGRCVTAAEAGLALDDVVAAYREQTRGDTGVCQLGFEEGRLRFSGTCVSSDSGETRSGAVLFLLSSNTVVVNAGLVEKLSEEKVAAALAHELAHYYRAHISRSFNNQGFFYEQRPDRSVADFPNPTRDVRLLDLGNRLRTRPVVASLRFSGQKFNSIPLSSLVFMGDAFDREVRRVCRDSRCAEACDPAIDAFRDVQVVKALRVKKIENEEQKRAYLDFEKSFSRCAQEIHLVDSDEDTLTDRRRLLSAMGAPWRDVMAEAFRSQRGGTLLEAVEFFSGEFDAVERQQLDDRRQAISLRLGWYSVEQEADELAAEILSLVGIEPEALEDLFFTLAEKTEPSPIGDYLDYESCRRAWKKRWKDDAGRLVFVPVGFWDDTHHSHCFRIFNVDREIETHDYHVRGEARPVLGGGSWESIQEEARRIVRRYSDRDERPR